MKNINKIKVLLAAGASFIFLLGSIQAVSAASPIASNLNASESYSEDTPLNLIDIVTSDSDGGVLTATLTVSNPAVGSLSTATAGATTSTYNAGTGVWTAAGAIANINTLLAGVVFTPALNSSANFSIATNVSDGGSSVSGSKAVIGTAVNDAPVLNASKTPIMNSMTEDDPVPSGLVGTSISNFIDFTPPAGGLDNVTDPDTMQMGIAITDINSNLSCYYSTNGGVAWVPVGAVSITNARLLAGDADNRLYCMGSANTNGTFPTAVTFQAWDQSSGIDGGLGDASVSGGSTAFSIVSDTISLTITAVNDGPNATNMSASEIYTINASLNLIDIVVSDVDSANVTVTLTLSNPSAGSLSTASSGAVTSTFNAGTGVWTATGAIADVNTLLSNVQFTPVTDFSSSFTIATSLSDGVASPISGSKIFTTFLLTEVTPLSGTINIADAVYHFSVNQAVEDAYDALEGDYEVEMPTCANCTVQIDPVAHTLYFTGLRGGDALDFNFLFSNGTVDSNLLRVGPFSIRNSTTSGSSRSFIKNNNDKSHPNGTLVIDGKTIYLIKDGQRWGFRNPAEYLSYGYNFNQAVPANAEDMALSFGAQNILKAMPGSLVIDGADKKTVYMIGSNYTKRGFVSSVVFAGLGYSFKDLPTINLSDYPSGPVIFSAKDAHPEGSLVLDGKTVWWLLSGGKKGFESQQVFDTYGFNSSRLVKANTADLALPIGSLVKLRDGTLVKENGSHYIISDGMKRKFGASATVSTMGYNLSNFISTVLSNYSTGSDI